MRIKTFFLSDETFNRILETKQETESVSRFIRDCIDFRLKYMKSGKIDDS